MASKASGTSLQKLKISTSALLSFVDSSVSTIEATVYLFVSSNKRSGVGFVSLHVWSL